MSNTRKYYDPLDDILDRPIAFNPAFKRITGSTNAALFLAQVWYWSKRTKDPDGWFYKTATEWQDETALTKDELIGARKICKAMDLVQERLKGVPATLFYRINKTEIYKLLGFQFMEIPETGLPENRQFMEKQETDEPVNIKESETTTEITTEYIEPVAAKLSEASFKFDPKSGFYIDEWKKDFPGQDDIIVRAIQLAVDKTAKNYSYVDAIIRDWKANGVPLTREEKIAASKTAKEQNTHAKQNYKSNRTELPKASQPEPTRDDMAAAESVRAKRAALRAGVPGNVPQVQ